MNRAWLRVCGVLGLLLALSIAGLAAQAPPVDEFVPVAPGDLQEQLPAAPLVFAAYAIVWLVLAFYLFSLWRRIGQVESELQVVVSKVEKTAR